MMSASGEHRTRRAREAADTHAVVESPDERSVPYLLQGILNALLAIGDSMKELAEQGRTK